MAIYAQPSVQWRFKIKQPIFSSPVASDGAVFFGGLDSTVYSVDIKTGSMKWKLKTNGEIRSNVVVNNNQLFLAGGNGVLSCIDKNSGKALWRVIFDQNAVFLAERRYDFADWYHSSPVIHNNVVYIGNSSGVMQAFKADNGELLWAFKANDIIHSTALILNERLYFGSFDGNLYALNIRDGSLSWKFKSVGQEAFPKGEFNSHPATDGKSIFIGSRDYNAYAVNAVTGRANWNKVFLAWAPSYTVKDTVVYVGTSDDRVFAALDTRDGHEIWKIGTKFNIFGHAAVTPGAVYIGTIWGRMLAVDPKNGNIKWTFETDGHKANRDKYFKKDDSFVDNIRTILPSASQWVGAEYKMGGIWSTPLVFEDKIILTTAEGTVYCLK